MTNKVNGTVHTSCQLAVDTNPGVAFLHAILMREACGKEIAVSMKDIHALTGEVSSIRTTREQLHTLVELGAVALKDGETLHKRTPGKVYHIRVREYPCKDAVFGKITLDRFNSFKPEVVGDVDLLAEELADHVQACRPARLDSPAIREPLVDLMRNMILEVSVRNAATRPAMRGPDYNMFSPVRSFLLNRYTHDSPPEHLRYQIQVDRNYHCLLRDLGLFSARRSLQEDLLVSGALLHIQHTLSHLTHSGAPTPLNVFVNWLLAAKDHPNSFARLSLAFVLSDYRNICQKIIDEQGLKSEFNGGWMKGPLAPHDTYGTDELHD